MCIFNIFKCKKSNTFYDALMEDWGKKDVYGPWTKEDPNDIEFKYYKRWWLISYDDGLTPKFETPDKDIRL